MLELSRRHQNIIIRVISYVVAGLLVLLLGKSDPGRSLVTGLSEAIHSSEGLTAAILWGVIWIVLSSMLFKVALGLWWKFRGSATALPSVLSRDLRVKPGEKISRLPVYRRIMGGLAGLKKPDPVKFVNELVSAGFSLGASDIHMNPGHDSVAVTLRVHGMLYELAEVDLILYPHIVRRVKVLSDLSTFKHDIPQDGHLRFEDGTYTGRVSLLPTNHGERMAIRLSTCTADILFLDNIGMPDDMLETHKALLSRHQGMIILTGPTGSGKSTTMFGSLLHIQSLRGESVNIVTLEDPIETDFTGFHQTQIGQSPGMTFATGLRAVLRQDPDIIMLGEIRDEETAQIAMRAATTGHLLFTTVHAPSTAGVFNRLLQMGIDSAQLSSGIHSIISQRLCHRLCPDCRHEAQITEEHIKQFRLIGIDEIPEGPFFISDGCEECMNKGYIGRCSLFEMLTVTDSLRDMIAEGAPSHRISQQAREDGMRSLLDHGLELARQGEVSLLEVVRTVSS